MFTEVFDREYMIMLCKKHEFGYFFTNELWEKFLDKWTGKKATKKALMTCGEELKMYSDSEYSLEYIVSVIFREGIFRSFSI